MKYTESHEWLRVEDGHAYIGITNHAQCELGDIVYVELPDLNASVSAGGEIAVLESTKAAADVYSPVSGEVVEVNEALEDAPELVNESPTEKGWIYKIKLSNPEELEKLMDQEAYEKVLG